MGLSSVKKPLFFIIFGLYPIIINGVFFINSLFFISWILWVTLFFKSVGLEWLFLTFVMLFLLTQGIFKIFSSPVKNYLRIKISNRINRIIKILGSTIFLLLFINSNFNKSSFFTQQFEKIYSTIEQNFNLLAVVFFSILLFCILFAILKVLLVKLSLKITSENGKDALVYFPLILFSALYLFIFIFLAQRYDQLSWIFKFSLLSLNVYYLLSETKNLLGFKFLK